MFIAFLHGGSYAQDIMTGDEVVDDILNDLPSIQIEDEKTGMVGEANAWLLYSSELGLTFGASGRFDFPGSKGRSISLGGEVSNKAQSGTLIYHIDDIRPDDVAKATAFDLTLRGNHGEARDNLPFQTSLIGLDGRFAWPLEGDANISTYLGVAETRIFHPTEPLSPIIVPDLGTTDRVFAGVELNKTRRLSSVAVPVMQHNASAEIAQLSGGVTLVRGTAGLATGGYFADDNANWRADFRAGALATAGGDSSIGDRFILGPASLRGFAYGGFGPHDGSQTLGGNYFAVSRFDVKVPGIFGEDAWLVPGAHVDFGSLWGLDNTDGGRVDDDFHLRGSAGVTFSTDIGQGTLDFSVTGAFLKQPDDQTQLLQLSFYSKF